MMKILLAIATILGSIGAVKWGSGTIFWIGFGVLSFVGVVLFILTTWGLVKLFKWSITLVLYDVLTTTTLIILSFKGVIGLNVAFATIIPLSALFLLILTRVIAYHAQTSVIWSEVFSWLTGYKIKSIIKVDKQTKTSKIVKVEEVLEDKQERDDIISALSASNLGFKVSEAKRAADYALQNEPDGSHAEKVKCALVYLNSNKLFNKIE